ncbi:hypothetical protein [Lysobacter sp. 22409]|uniref:hypothetical protein n=1 Tax=Lysobacter sp. 22409 TaxID=3453917 RepID=UPI003F82AF57
MSKPRKKKKKKKRKKQGKHPGYARLPVPDALDQGFASSWATLADLFSGFNARDVFVSLLASELWLPNLSAQVKH